MCYFDFENTTLTLFAACEHADQHNSGSASSDAPGSWLAKTRKSLRVSLVPVIMPESNLKAFSCIRSEAPQTSLTLLQGPEMYVLSVSTTTHGPTSVSVSFKKRYVFLMLFTGFDCKRPVSWTRSHSAALRLLRLPSLGIPKFPRSPDTVFNRSDPPPVGPFHRTRPPPHETSQFRCFHRPFPSPTLEGLLSHRRMLWPSPIHCHVHVSFEGTLR
jgi:hypothetical protein